MQKNTHTPITILSTRADNNNLNIRRSWDETALADGTAADHINEEVGPRGPHVRTTDLPRAVTKDNSVKRLLNSGTHATPGG